MSIQQQDAGIAIGPILFLVALLGVLAAAIAAGSGSFTAGTSTESNRANATSILAFAEQMRRAVQIVRSGNNCDDNQISFENGAVTGYTNSNAPADFSCHVFRPEGGRVQYQAPPRAATTIATEYYFLGNACFDGAGSGSAATNCAADGNTSNEDLYLLLPNLNIGTCDAINRLLGFSSGSGMPRDSGGTSINRFIGTYADGHFRNNELPPLSTIRPLSACMSSDVSNPLAGTFSFFAVLVVR